MQSEKLKGAYLTIYFPHPTDCDTVIAVELGTLTTIDLDLPEDDWDFENHKTLDPYHFNLNYVDELEWTLRIGSAFVNADGKAVPCYHHLLPIDDQSEAEYYKRRVELSTP